MRMCALEHRKCTDRCVCIYKYVYSYVNMCKYVHVYSVNAVKLPFIVNVRIFP